MKIPFSVASTDAYVTLFDIGVHPFDGKGKPKKLMMFDVFWEPHKVIFVGSESASGWLLTGTTKGLVGHRLEDDFQDFTHGYKYGIQIN